VWLVYNLCFSTGLTSIRLLQIHEFLVTTQQIIGFLAEQSHMSLSGLALVDLDDRPGVALSTEIQNAYCNICLH